MAVAFVCVNGGIMLLTILDVTVIHMIATSASDQTYVHTYIRTYVSTYLHIYIVTYIHSYTHTYVHTYIHVHI